MRCSELHAEFHTCVRSEPRAVYVVFEVELLAPVIFRHIPHIAGVRVRDLALQACARGKTERTETRFVSNVNHYAMTQTESAVLEIFLNEPVKRGDLEMIVIAIGKAEVGVKEIHAREVLAEGNSS